MTLTLGNRPQMRGTHGNPVLWQGEVRKVLKVSLCGSGLHLGPSPQWHREQTLPNESTTAWMTSWKKWWFSSRY